MKDLHIDYKRCAGCLQCVRICPVFALAGDEHNHPVYTRSGASRCINCQHCMTVCPAGALSINGVSPADCPPHGSLPPPDEMMNLIRQRRSIRNYKQQNVDRELMTPLLDSIRFCPTGENTHLLHVSVIDDLDRMNLFRNMLYERISRIREKTHDANKRYPFLRPIHRMLRRGMDPIFRTAPHALFISVRKDAPGADADPIIAMTQFELLAQCNKLGCCWCGFLVWALQKIAPDMQKMLGISEDETLSYALLFGYPAERFNRPGLPPAVPVSRF